MGFYDLNAGRDARDDAFARAERKKRNRDWMSGAIRVICATFKKDWEGLAEEFQQPVIAAIGGPPNNSYGLWGQVSNFLIRKKIFIHIEWDPEVRAKGRKSHTQCTKVSSHGCDGKIMRKIV